MLISNVYRPGVLSCRAEDRLDQVARRMVEEDVGALAVYDGERVAGIITERDIVGALAAGATPESWAIAHASTRLKTAALDEDSGEVARRMLDEGIRHLPVDDEGRLVGMVSMRDLLALEIWTR